MSFSGISTRQHLGGNNDSVCTAVVIKVVMHSRQYECLHWSLYIFLLGRSSKHDAHSDLLKGRCYRFGTPGEWENTHKDLAALCDLSYVALFPIEGRSFIACFTGPMIFVLDDRRSVKNMDLFDPDLAPSTLSLVVGLVLKDDEVVDVDGLGLKSEGLPTGVT